MITIFTPTYTRAHLLDKLYVSLCSQTQKDFEWLIVDDGSTDGTEPLVAQFIKEGKISIRYLKQENGGKHRAINRGVKVARGELFFIVDSDDVLTPDAVETVNHYYDQVRGDGRFAGVCGLKAYFTGEKVGGEKNYDVIDCNNFDFRFKHHVKGDMAEVFRTDILKEFPFPEIEGEKYCAEGVVWNNIANKYILRYFYKKIYLCDYLPDGLSLNSIRMRMKSPVSACICYSNMIKYPIPFMQKVKAAVNYWRFWFCESQHKKPSLPCNWWWCLPMGMAFHFLDIQKAN